MGKLNIAHHKSYHPYRRDNIERVRRDEEEAHLKEAAAEGRILLAVRDTISPSFTLERLTPRNRIQRHGWTYLGVEPVSPPSQANDNKNERRKSCSVNGLRT